MVLKLRVECMSGVNCVHECVRAIAMDDSSSLLDLHERIQDAVSFGRDHPFTFYTANSASPRAYRHWITDMDHWDKREPVFRDTQLKDIWPLGRRRLYYWFDFGDDWIFEIRKLRHSKSDESLSTPIVLERIGPDPVQYPVFEE